MILGTPPHHQPTTPARRRLVVFLGQYGTIVGLVLMVVFFSLARPAIFPTWNNLINVVNQVSLTAIIAVGLTMPLAVGEFDLSIGYAASLAGVLVAGLMVNQGVPWPAAVAAVLALGALIGLVNGLFITKAGVNALIATLGTGTILVGFNYAYTGGSAIAFGLPDAFRVLTARGVLGIPNTIFIMAGIVTVLWILLNRTDLGQSIQAVGGNPVAAALSGIRVERVKTIAFVVSGLCAALTGILLTARIGSGESTAGDGFLLDAMAAAFLGSATLRDGEFHVLGTLIGVLIVGIGFNGLNILNVPTFSQFFLKGAMLIVAVALSSIARRHAKA
jgi:ribose transport system permease protein